MLAALTLLGCSSSSDKEEIPEYKLAGSLSQDLELPAGLALTGKQTHMQVPDMSEQDRQSVLNQGLDFEYPPQTQVSEDEAPVAAKPEMKLSSDTPSLKSYKTRMSKDQEGVPQLVVEAQFLELWDRLAQVIQTLGFAIEDKNKANQTYKISKTLTSLRLFEPEKLVGEEQDPEIEEGFTLAITTDKGEARVKVQDREGRDDASGVASHLLVQIQNVLENPK